MQPPGKVLGFTENVYEEQCEIFVQPGLQLQKDPDRKSVSRIAEECQVERSGLDSRHTKELKYFPPPPGEMWRIPLLQELLDIRKDRAHVSGVSHEEIEDIINDICVN